MTNQDLPEGKQPVGDSSLVEIISPDSPAVASAVPVDKKIQPVTEKDGYVRMHIPKRVIWSLAIAAIIFIAGLLAWHFNLYKAVVDMYNTTSYTVRVKEDDKFALQGATVTILDRAYTSDENGKVSIAEIVAGTYTVKVEKEGYMPLEQQIDVIRGDNEIKVLSLSKVVEKLYTLQGVVKDYVTEDPLVDVQVSTSGRTVRTNPAGEFSFDKLTLGDYKLILSKSGYEDKEHTASLKVDDTTAHAVSLAPSGNVVFVSNRTGSRSLYIANYDGTLERQLVAPAGGGEDYAPLLSPDGKWVVFASTRDGIKNSYNAPAARLYIVSRDGKDLRKVSDDYAQSHVRWSPSSAYIYYEGYADTQLSNYIRRFYDVAKANTFDLGEAGTAVTFSNAGNAVAYTTTLNNQTTLHYLNIASGERRIITEKTASYFSNLSFNVGDQQIKYEAFLDQGMRKYEITVSGSSETELVAGTTDTRTYYYSPDKKQKVFVEERDGKRDLFLIGADLKEKRLTTDGVVHPTMAPRWDSTGKYLIVPYQKEGEKALYIVGTNGKVPKKIVDYYDDQSAPYVY